MSHLPSFEKVKNKTSGKGNNKDIDIKYHYHSGRLFKETSEIGKKVKIDKKLVDKE